MLDEHKAYRARYDAACKGKRTPSSNTACDAVMFETSKYTDLVLEINRRCGYKDSLMLKTE